MTEALMILILDVDGTTQKALESGSNDSVRAMTFKDFNHLVASIREPDIIPHFILISCQMPKWIEHTRRLFREQNSIPTGIICDRSLPETDQARIMVAARGAGADYALFKPFKPDLLREATNWALGYKLSAESVEICKQYLVGESTQIQRVRRQTIAIAKRIQSSNNTYTLVRGETGTGKEQVARAIRALTGIEMITLDIKSLAPGLVESELFGCVRGAYPGAIDRAGFFEKADGKILFFDEFGNIPWDTQDKLLRVLETREFHRVGCTIVRKIDCHILFATNRPLEKMVECDSFRSDLLARIKYGGQLHLPPLRDRGEDALILAQYIIELKKPGTGIKLDDVGEILLRKQMYPNNVRDIIAMVEAGLRDPSGRFNSLAMLDGLSDKSNDEPVSNDEQIHVSISADILDKPLFEAEAELQSRLDSIYFHYLHRKFQGDFQKIKARAGDPGKPLAGRPFYERWDNADPPLPPRPLRSDGDK